MTTVLAGFRYWAIAVLAPAVLGLGACAAGGRSGETPHSAPHSLGDASYGAYLSGRMAGALNDMDAAAAFYKDALAKDPDNPTLLERTFSTSLANGRYEDALAIAERMAERNDTSSSLAPLLLILEDIRAGRYDSARERADSMPSGGFNTLIGPLTRAWILAGQERWEEAIAALGPLADTSSFTAFQDFHTALILAMAGHDDRADKMFQDTVSAPGGVSVRAILAYGRFLVRHDRAEEALSIYNEYLKTFPNNPLMHAAREAARNGDAAPVVASPAAGLAEVFYDTAQALNRRGTRGPAIMYARLALFLKPDFAESYQLLGNLLEASGRDQAAAEAFSQISEDSPLYWRARHNYATLTYRLGRIDEAVQRLNDMRAERPGDLSVVTTLADLYRHQERYAEAQELYEYILSKIDDYGEKHWTLFYARAVTYAETGPWKKAEADFLKALELSPEEPLVLNYLGYSWIDRGENLEEALKLIRKAVELKPNDGNIVDSLGWALYKLGRYEEAVQELERAVLLRPENPEINEHLGDAYWRVGRFLEARFQWSHAIALGADDEQVSQIERKLEDGLKDGGSENAKF